jgi:cutinase
MHNAVSTLPANLKSKVVGGVLFGDTRNKQDRGQVPNYPKNNVIIFCVRDDGVCGGKLNVNAGHFAYTRNGDGPKAINFLKSKIDAAMGGRGRSVAEEMTLLETRAAKGKGAKDPLPNGGESAFITV